ncbi:glutathione S-transferase N-terminal domain-containing protein [Pseudomonas boanensis]|uniref:glutathione S-transferase N-terminal domain-containing protein n=1 Tax=Metapseudomonas boanensis TaxID=2822138 RepID=UPI0035D3E67B
MFIKALRVGLGQLIIFIDFITRPRKLRRSAEEQARIAEEAASLALYQFNACPFCVKTRRAMHRLNLPIVLRDAKNDEAHRADLLAGGGKIKVPCLRIEESGESRWMYESNDIIRYLESRFTQA